MTHDVLVSTNALANSPIAVVGLSCRLPKAVTPEEMWTLLRNGTDAVDGSPRFATPQWGAGTRRGGYLDRVDEFDPGFFAISPREAAAMDPHQRLMLELAWEAVEDAGIVADALRGSPTGVFVGAIAHDYVMLVARRGPEEMSAHTFTGMQRGLIANRVSYALGLTGPSLTVDTAQSSSLVAVHLACESLCRGESELAIAAGVNLILAQDSTTAMAELGALSPDGRCAVFDEHANGYVRGEGGAAVVLKPLSRALADGDDIYCVVTGSAMNNDGGGGGLTVPESSAQARLFHQACARAGVAPDALQYVELHGTGTPVGDPVEATAVGAVFGASRPAGDPLRVGSVKSNVGHLEGAAGIVGLMKVALSVRHREIPATLHHVSPSRRIPFDRLNLRVQTRTGPWPREHEPLVAGVSSFGIGGTNCHVVVAEPPGARPARARAEDTPPVRAGLLPWVLTGRTEDALRAQARRLHAHVAGQPGTRAEDLGMALATTRSAFEHRAVVLGRERVELMAGVDAVAGNRPCPGVIRAVGEDLVRPVFVFPGQGCQWAGMAYGLWQSSAVFREHMEACEKALVSQVDWSLSDVISDPSGALLRRPDVMPPALFAVMTSTARLWRACGVEPAAVTGTSQGEIAAAYTAGVLSLTDAVHLITRRSSVLAAHLAGKGAMVWLALSEQDVASVLSRCSGDAVLSGVNGLESVTVSGGLSTLDQLMAECAAKGIRARWINNGLPTHGPKVEPARAELLDVFNSVTHRPAEVPFFSSATGERLRAGEPSADYWYRLTRQPVRFDRAAQALLQDGYTTFLEMGPHPVLGVDLTRTAELAGRRAVVLASLRRDDGGAERFVTSMAEAWAHGVGVRWDEFFRGTGAQRVKLPTYPFQRGSFRLGAVAEPAPEDTARSETGSTGSVRARLTGLIEEDQLRVVLDLVLAHVASVLGHPSTDSIDQDRAFRELGVDSQIALQLRTRLADATELRLPATLLFEHATVRVLASHLHTRICRAMTSETTV